MKKLGTIYGVNLILDTDDEKIYKQTVDYFKDLNKKTKSLHDTLCYEEVDIQKSHVPFRVL